MLIDVRPIKNEKDYEWALAEVEKYFIHKPQKGTKGEVRFEVLSELIASYEGRRYPIAKSTPIRVIKFYMEQNGLSQKDFAKLLGSQSRASEILSGKREPSKGAIKKITQNWGIPVDCLIPFKKYTA